MNPADMLALFAKVSAGEITPEAASALMREKLKKEIPGPEFTWDKEKGKVLLGGIKKGPKFGLTDSEWEVVRAEMGIADNADGTRSYDPAKDKLGALLTDIKNNSVKEADLEPVKATEEKKEGETPAVAAAPAAPAA